MFGERLRGEVRLLLDHFASGSDYMFTAIGKQAACARGQQNPDTVGCFISCEIAKDFQKTRSFQFVLQCVNIRAVNTIGRSQIRFNRRRIHRLRVVECGLYGGLSGIVLLSTT